ncbi:protein THYLAKOID ASSEMBLY 8-like, chloroplastic isoform X2 [Actinidia eriantha]|uniref:protein THYLAKOID ASSEMBLY 8-like, chloroplastic isoform X2 n=1 Tax=Actinidia eriantha TaxID=165200 RepID=UPI00258E6E66|nr:protein THYLAKOID ASSEMBLY 8-like, chloroplastic isoform X2 [Actinidia eriantha]
MSLRAICRSKSPFFASALALRDVFKIPTIRHSSSSTPQFSHPNSSESPFTNGLSRCNYHDGRPRGSLWRGKKLIGKEAISVVMGLKRLKDDEEKIDKFVKTHVSRLLKMDMIAVLLEFERQEEVNLAFKLWETMRKEDLFPDSQTYTEVVRGFLTCGSPGDAMNIYEDMKQSPDPPEELPFRILLKGLLPHPLLRNRVKQDFEEIFPDSHSYDPPEAIFGLR